MIMIKQIIRINEKTLVIDDTKYKRVRNLGRGKSGYVDLYESNGELIAVKFYEYETDDPKINPIPEEEILSYEVSVYEELVKLDIPLAQLLGYDSKLKILVKEYINGSNIIDLVAENKIDDDIWKKIFKISKT
ncbi:hypothetical protein HZI73_06965 [Vallitalea pronyensis]|uniref:Protein kinase domain-containing protein n=1 Tax=Vallitalea pronyensis TaxID=1348613 RepID=A0A8J8MIB2_9FIRM|nr:hypothetical protein [Vallitalea pronyensis]QUI22056.1 hypothetical protein HZI73_06965 [Vallitalea pronyensis]